MMGDTVTMKIDAEQQSVSATGEMEGHFVDEKVTRMPTRAFLIAQILTAEALKLFRLPTSELVRQAAAAQKGKS
jgi:hypothetical protein